MADAKGSRRSSVSSPERESGDGIPGEGKDERTRCGFVALIGAPNVGKSTLVNALVGTKVAIVSHKAQTTRASLRGIAIVDGSQLVFIDTPGIFAPKRRLDRAMVTTAWVGAGDADIAAVLIDAKRGLDEEAGAILERLAEIGQTKILLINKIDLVAKPALLAIASSAGFATRSILLMSRILVWPISASRSRIAPASSSRPRFASISTAAISASSTPIHAVVTIARSSRRLGAKMPGVSINTSCEPSTIAMPRNNVRVVCALWDTIATLVPTSALTSVDLPTLGAPINATNPQRVRSFLPSPGMPSPLSHSREETGERREPFASAIEAVGFDAGAGQHCGCGGLLGGALRAAKPLSGRQMRELDGDAEFRIMVGTLALDLTIGRSRQPARLRPFLQHGFGIAQRPRRRAHAFAPQPLDQCGSGGISAIDDHCPDQRLASIGEDGSAAAAAGIGLRCPEPDCRTKIDRPCHVRAGLLAYQISETTRHLPLVGFCEGAEQHVRDDEPKHVITKKLQPLVRRGAVARPAQRGNVRERLLEQRGILEAVADAFFERRQIAAPALLCAGLRILIGSGETGRLAVGSWIGCFDRSRLACSPAAHLTIVNSRFQRTAQGQRHTIHACSPSRIEKKMIWARPMMFSNGT